MVGANHGSGLSSGEDSKTVLVQARQVYIFPNRCPGAECEPNQWHAQFWASSMVTITPCCKSYREVKKLAKHMIKEEKTRKWL